MSDSNQPKDKQWWRDAEDEILYVVGRTPTEEVICVDANNTIFLFDDMPSWEHWKRLPDDAGFDWKPEPEIVFDPKKFTSDWGPFEKPSPDRWFIWSDNRYPIAFVKHDDGKVQNLNVDLVLKQSDDWHHGYEEQLTNGELVEVTEFSAKAFLKQPRSASQIPKHEPPKPNRIPVRQYWYDGNVVARYGHTPPTDPSFIEIKLDPEMIISGSGFYVEGQVSP